MTTEIRAFDFDVRADQDEQHGTFLTGQPIVFGSQTEIYHPVRGRFIEIIDFGALDNTDLKDVRFLINHDTNMIPLARSRNNNENSTMQLQVDEGRGLIIRVNLDTENNADAKALYSAVERGDISGMSFMFTVDEDIWEDLKTDLPKRHVRSIGRVMEVSAVTFPAYEATSIQARGLSDALDSAWVSLDSAKAEVRKLDLAKEKLKLKARIQNGN